MQYYYIVCVAVFFYAIDLFHFHVTLLITWEHSFPVYFSLSVSPQFLRSHCAAPSFSLSRARSYVIIIILMLRNVNIDGNVEAKDGLCSARIATTKTATKIGRAKKIMTIVRNNVNWLDAAREMVMKKKTMKKRITCSYAQMRRLHVQTHQ